MTSKLRVLYAHDDNDGYLLLRRALSIAGEDIELVQRPRGDEPISEVCRRLGTPVGIVDADVAGHRAARIVEDARPARVVLFGTTQVHGPEGILDALAAGAVGFADLPQGISSEQLLRWAPPKADPAEGGETWAQFLVRLLHRASHVRPVDGQLTRLLVRTRTRVGRPVLLFGSSMGGPAALQRIFADLPRDLPAAGLIVQHMPAEFTTSLAERLTALGGPPVREARDGDALEEGCFLIVPGGRHAVFEQGRRIRIVQPDETCRFVPSIDAAFLSAARVVGPDGVGVLLTGMGKDGVLGLYQVSSVGGMTVAQSEGSSTIAGMPGAAIRLGLANRVVPLHRLGRELHALVKTRRKTRKTHIPPEETRGDRKP